MRFEEKIAGVTGAARGIGKAFAITLAREGATVVLCDVDLAEAQKAAAEIRAAGGKASAIQLDISDQRSVNNAVSEIVSQYGRIDLWFNNAGVASIATIFDTTPEEIDRVIKINLYGTLFCCLAVGRVMAAEKSGNIVNVASISGQHGGGQLGKTIYAASKGGVLAMTKGYAKELAPYGVRVNSVAPSSVDTAITEKYLTPEAKEEGRKRIPLGRRAQPEDIVGAALFLASDEAGFITGECINVNGGLLML